jgi:hypothetical protein
MAVADRSGLLIAVASGVDSETPHEVTLLEATLGTRFMTRRFDG